MTNYCVTLVKDRGSSNNIEAARGLNTSTRSALSADGIGHFGVFAPLFGLASNELYLVTHADKTHSPAKYLQSTNLDILESIDLVPTVRPVDHSPRTVPGIYVFRWFEVYKRDVDEIVRLSREAWVTFEGGFDTEVQGLFAEPDRSGERGKMLLITWYRDLSVWQASRRPAAEARENFRRRAQLTIEAKPIATGLVPAEEQE